MYFIIYRCNSSYRLRYWNSIKSVAFHSSWSCNSSYRLRYWNYHINSLWIYPLATLQQLLPFTVLKRIQSGQLLSHVKSLQQLLPFTVCAEGCETAEEQSDDEVRTSQVPERSEGKTRVIRDSAYRLRYWNIGCTRLSLANFAIVATVLTVYGMRRRVRDSRESKRRWGPHISSTWTK